MKWENSFKPKVAIAKFIGKMQKKSGLMKSGLDATPLFLLDDLLRCYLNQNYLVRRFSFICWFLIETQKHN